MGSCVDASMRLCPCFVISPPSSLQHQKLIDRCFSLSSENAEVTLNYQSPSDHCHALPQHCFAHTSFFYILLKYMNFRGQSTVHLPNMETDSTLPKFTLAIVQSPVGTDQEAPTGPLLCFLLKQAKGNYSDACSNGKEDFFFFPQDNCNKEQEISPDSE